MLKAQSGPCDSDGEQFVPAPVSVVLGNPAVQLLRGPSKDQSGFAVVAKAPTASQVAGLGKTYYLDIPGDPLHAGCTYEEASRELMQGKSPTVYAHVLGEPGVKGVALQYWFFWYFNQFNDVHEGDWEMIQIAWDGTSSVEDALARAPDRIALAQHGGGELASWSSSKLQREGDHPKIYPASGSHATYYDDALWLGTGQNGSGFGCDDSTAPSRRVTVDAVVVPNGDVRSGPFAWLSYEGKWGQYEPALNNGPDGPAQHSQWREPFRWMDGLRSSSPEVPLGSSFGPSVTGVFCGVIATGSIAYNRLSRHPGVIYLLIAGIVLLAIYLTRRTAWSPAPVVPLDQPRRTGQILTAAARVYGVRGRELLALGAVFVPLSAVAALLQQLIFENRFVDALGHSTASDAASAAIALIIGTFSAAVAYTLVVALVSVVLRDELAGSRPGWRPAYTTVARRLWPLVTTQLLVTFALIGLVPDPHRHPLRDQEGRRLGVHSVAGRDRGPFRPRRVAGVNRSRPRRLEAHGEPDDRAGGDDARAGAARGNRPDLHHRAAALADQRRGLDHVCPRRAVHGHGARPTAARAPPSSRDGRSGSAGRSLSDRPHHFGELAHSGLDGRLGDGPVAEHQRRGSGVERLAVVGHRVEDDPPAGGLVANGLRVIALGQFDRHVQAGGDARDDSLGELTRERLHHRVALPAVARTHAAQVPVELASRDEIGECVLLDARCSAVADQLVLRDALEQYGGHDEPAQAERGRERLARRARIDHVLGREPLQRPDGSAVVAVLGVVVVLDRHRAVRAQPVHEGQPPLAAEHDTGRLLMGGSDDHGVRRQPGELVHAEAVRIDADRNRLEAGAGDDCLIVEVAGVLHPDTAGAPGGQGPAHESEPLRVAVGDDHALGVGHDATHPAEIAGQGRAQDVRPARIAVAELGIGHARERRAQRPQPRRPREGREIGPARAEVEAHTSRRRA